MSKSRILLIDPPFYRFLGESQNALPLGLSYLAGTLKANGYQEVFIYNADIDRDASLAAGNRARYAEMNAFEHYEDAVKDLDHPAYQEVLDTIKEVRPTIIGITLRTAKFFITKVLTKKIRQHFPDITIVIGGAHASSCPHDVLSIIGADYVVRGEGEITFLELIRAIEEKQNPREVLGISYNLHGVHIDNPDRTYVDNIDEIAFPDRHSILYSEAMGPEDYGYLFTSRGCPYACSFCDSRGTWSRRVRRMSHERLIQEIQQIRHDFGTTFFSFQDDCLVTKRSVAIDMCNELKKAGLSDLPRSEFRWWCEIHPNVVTEELIAAMKGAGCVAIAIGAESGSQRSLKQVKKGSTVDTIKRAARIIREANISLTTFFMIGFPWETREDIQETIQLMDEIQPDNPALSVLTPLPATPIFDYTYAEGLISPGENDYLHYFHQRATRFYNKNIPEDEAKALIESAFKKCEEVKNSRKIVRLEQFFIDNLSPLIQQKCDLKLQLGDDITIQQNWEEQQIDVFISQCPTKQKKTVSNLIREALLVKFPEYNNVNIINKEMAA